MAEAQAACTYCITIMQLLFLQHQLSSQSCSCSLQLLL